MSPRPALFRQVDVTRALRAARAAGLEVSEFKISAQGDIVISNAVGHIPSLTEKSAVPSGPSDYELWKAKQRCKSKNETASTTSENMPTLGGAAPASPSRKGRRRSTLR